MSSAARVRLIRDHFAARLARREADQPVVVIVPVELSVDPATAKGRVDGLRLGKSWLGAPFWLASARDPARSDRKLRARPQRRRRSRTIVLGDQRAPPDPNSLAVSGLSRTGHKLRKHPRHGYCPAGTRRFSTFNAARNVLQSGHSARGSSPDRAANLIQGRHLNCHWNGGRLDLYRDAARSIASADQCSLKVRKCHCRR